MSDTSRRACFATRCLCLSVFIAIVASISCDNGRRPVEPTQPKDYLLYFMGNYGTYYAYHTLRGTIDTFSLPYDAWWARVSADGKSFYVGLEAESTLVVDLSTKSVTDIIPYGGAAIVGPDGKSLAMCGNPLALVRTSDYTAIYLDSQQYQFGDYSADGRSFYYTVPESTGFAVYRIQLDRNCEAQQWHFKYHPLPTLTPSFDENKWFWRTPTTGYDYFEVFDVSNSMVLFRHSLPGQIGIYVLPDNRRLIYCNSWTVYPAPYPWGVHDEIYVFDTHRNLIDTVIHPYLPIPGQDTVFNYAVLGMVVPPGSNYLYALGNDGGGGLGFVRIDLRTYEQDSAVYMGPNAVSIMSCQSLP